MPDISQASTQDLLNSLQQPKTSAPEAKETAPSSGGISSVSTQDLLKQLKPDSPFDVAGNISQDVLKGAGAGVARMGDLMANYAMPPELTGRRAALEESFQEQFGKPKYPLAYDLAKNIAPSFLLPGGGVGAGLAKAATGGAQNALLTEAFQQAEDKKFNPAALATSGLMGAGLGAGAHKLFGWVSNLFEPKEAEQALEHWERVPDSTGRQYLTPEARAAEAQERAQQIAQQKLAEQEQYRQALAAGDHTKAAELAQRQALYDAAIEQEKQFGYAASEREAQERAEQVAQEKARNKGEFYKPLPQAEAKFAEDVPVKTVRQHALEYTPKGEFGDVAAKLFAEKLQPALALKRKWDQAQHNFWETVKKAEGVSGQSFSKPKGQAIPYEDYLALQRLAAQMAGVAEPTAGKMTSKIHIVGMYGSKGMSLPKYIPHGKEIKTLLGEANRWRLLANQYEKQFHEALKAEEVENFLPAKQSTEIPYKGHVYQVSHKLGAAEYLPPGATPEQLASFREIRAQMTKEAEFRLWQLNRELEPSWKAVTDYVAQTDPAMGKVVNGRKIETADKAIMAQAEKEGWADNWKTTLQGLIDFDNYMARGVGVGLMAAGQAVGGKPAEAASGQREDNNMAGLGTALTFAGAVLAGGPLAKKVLSLSAHFTTIIPQADRAAAIKAGAKAGNKLGARIAKYLSIATVSRANMDAIEDAAPEVAAQLDKLLSKWAKAVGGKDLIPGLERPVEEQQAWARGMYGSEELDKLPLNPRQRQALAQVRLIKKEGAKILKAKIEQLVPKGATDTIYGDAALARMLNVELRLNWETGTPESQHVLESIITTGAHAITGSVQLGSMHLHFTHVAAGSVQVGSRLGKDFITASALLAKRDKNAVNFANSFNTKMPIFGNLEDTESKFANDVARKVEKGLERLTGGVSTSIKKSKLSSAVRTVGSGAGVEKYLKMDIAIVGASEQVARKLGYPSGRVLRADLTAWLNGQTNRTTGHFTEAKGLAAMQHINGILNQGLGAGPAGYRVGLVLDRAGSWGKILAPFSRSIIIGVRSTQLLAKDVLTALDKGDFKGAATAGTALVGSVVMTGAWGAGFIPKEIDDHILKTDPLLHRKLRIAQDQMAFISNATGIHMKHMQPTMEWIGRLSAPLATQYGKSLVDIGRSKSSDSQKLRAAVTLMAGLGINNIADTISVDRLRQIAQAYDDAAKQGGLVHYTYTEGGPLDLYKSLPKDFDFMGIQQSRFVSARLIPMKPGQAAMTKALMPGELKQAEELTGNSLEQYYAEKLIKDKFGQSAHDAFAEFLGQHMPVSKALDKEARATGSHERTAAQWKVYEAEQRSPINLFGQHTTVEDFWTTALEMANSHPEWASNASPSEHYTKMHHRQTKAPNIDWEGLAQNLPSEE